MKDTAPVASRILILTSYSYILQGTLESSGDTQHIYDLNFTNGTNQRGVKK